MHWMSPRSPHVKGAISRGKLAAQDMHGHVLRSIYSKRLGRGQHRNDADADCGVLDWVHIGATWQIKAMCGSDAALCQITLATCFRFLVHGQVNIIFVVSVGLYFCLFVCVFVCAEFFSAVFDPISIKL